MEKRPFSKLLVTFLQKQSSLSRRCFALCERLTVENWWTAAAVIMLHLCVKMAPVTLSVAPFTQFTDPPLMVIHGDVMMMTFKMFTSCPPVNLARGMEAIFWGKVHSSLGRECWPSWWFIFITNTRWVKVFCRWPTLVFRQKCEKELGGQTLLHVYLLYFFPHIRHQRQSQSLCYFGLVM